LEELLYQNYLKNSFDICLNLVNQLSQLDPNNPTILHDRGLIYMKLGRYKESEEEYQKSLEINGNSEHSWLDLGTLYQIMGEYKKAELAFKNSLNISPEWSPSWNTLGNLYHNHLRKYSEAEYAYLKAIDIDENFAYPKYNLVFLYRDKLNKLKEAKELFESIPDNKDLRDSHFLNKALFAYYEKNAGIAKGFMIEALDEIDDSLPSHTQDDWWKAAATVVKLGYGTHFLQILSESGYDVILRPYYVAIQALIRKNSDLFFNSIAAEVREPAKRILEMMKKYNQ
jgi:tetratricopeptide (TPR) repeat protein